MKVPPKRKGKCAPEAGSVREHVSLNESPSEKEGKTAVTLKGKTPTLQGLNESPSEKEGKTRCQVGCRPDQAGLNESPSEKEGKSGVSCSLLGMMCRPQ